MHPEFPKILINANTYQECIEKMFGILSQENKTFSYGQFAKKAGFASRSFVRDIEKGTKKLTSSSAEKFVKALGLEHELAEYFMLLVKENNIQSSKSEPLAKSKVEHAKLLKKKCIYKEIISRYYLSEDTGKIEKDVFHYSSWPKIFVCISNYADTIESICKKTKFSRLEVRNALKDMQIRGVVEELPDGTYLGKSFHLLFKDLGKDKFFKQYFLNSLKETENIAKENFEDNESNIFLNSVFTIDKNQFPILKKQLNDLVIQFINENEKSGGENLVNIVMAFTNHK